MYILSLDKKGFFYALFTFYFLLFTLSIVSFGATASTLINQTPQGTLSAVTNEHFVFRDHAGDSVSIVVTGHVVRYSFQDGSYLELDGGSKNLTRYDSASAFHEVISLEPHQIQIWHTSATNLAILNKMRLHADATVTYEIHPDQGECLRYPQKYGM